MRANTETGKTMKKYRWQLLLGLVLLLSLSACGSTTPEAIPTIVLDSGGSDTTTQQPAQVSSSRGDIIASAVIVPSQEAHLAFVAGGNIKAVNVAIGEKVEAGQILVELDNTIALLEVERAKRALRELTSQAEIATAEETLALALETRDDEAHDVVALDYGRASQEMIDEVQAEITLAKDRLEVAQATYNRVTNLSLENSRRASALLALNDAKTYLNSLHANYQWYISPPSETDVAKTTAQAAVAEAAYQEAQWYLAALNGEKLPSNATGTKLTQLQQAQDNLEAAQNRLEQTRLISPISGIVSEINIIAGEFATPGKILLVVSDMGKLQVKTTDLSERDIIKIKLGDPASIIIDALNEEFSGKIITISPVADSLGGDVIYKVTLSFDEQPVGALDGMTAEVTFEE